MINNQVAINFLNQVRKILLDDKSWLESTIQPINEAFDMAIKALQAQDDHDINVGSMISRQAAIDACIRVRELRAYDEIEEIKALPSAQPKWNKHAVACLLAELFDDPCACNYNGIDEWLPEKCEVIDACPNPVGVACWEQYLKHRAERRTDELGDS